MCVEVPRFARGLLVAADREHDHVGLLRDLHGFGDLLAVLFRIARRRLRSCVPRAADGDLAAFAVEDLRAVADLVADALEHRDVVLRHAAVAAEQAAIGIGADHRDRFELASDRAEQVCRRSSAA